MRLKKVIYGVLLSLISINAFSLDFTASVIDAKGPPKIWGKGKGDLNGDGRKDIISIVTTGIAWFENNGGNSNWPVHQIVSGKKLHDIEVIDLDLDGKLDIVARDQGNTGNVLYIYRQKTLTSWALSQITLPTTGEGLVVHPVDDDELPDIIVGRYWFKNKSSTNNVAFTRFTYSTAAPINSYVAVGDLNGDGRADIVTSPAEPVGGVYRTSWFEAPLDRTKAWEEHILETNVPTVTHFSGIADFDKDGHMDVATALTEHAPSPSIKVFQNLSGDGPSGAPVIVAPTSSHSMKIILVRGENCLLGADYDKPGSTPVRMFCP